MRYDLRVPDASGNKLEVLQELPDKGDKFPTVLMVPGFGMDLHEHDLFDDICAELLRNGFQTFRFSFAGTGKSEGDFTQMTVKEQVSQLKTVINCVKKDRFTNRRKIGILSQSFGTVVTVAALPLTGIKTFLFTSTIAYPGVVMEKLFKREHGYHPEGISVRQRGDGTKMRIGPQFWTSLSRYNLPRLIRQLSSAQSILFIHGSRDQKVKAWEAVECYNAVAGRKKYLLMEGADHAYTRKYRFKVLGLISEWFNEMLR